MSSFQLKNFSSIRACVISGARKAKYLDVIIMFTHSQGNTPLGQSERARSRATFLRSRTPTGSHSRQCEYSAHVFTSVRSGRKTPLLKFKIEREILVLESSRLGKNYLVISDMGVKLFALFPFTFFVIKVFEVPMWSTRLSHPKVSNFRK